MTTAEPVGRMFLGSAGYKALGKLIDEWSFQQPFHGADRAPPYKIEVFMRKRNVGVGSGIHGVIEFVAHCVALPGTMMVNSDIEGLRAAVEDHLRERAILSSGVIWEDWLEVIVCGGKRKYGSPVDGEELVIEYKMLRRGRHPDLPGRDYTINNNHVAVKFPAGKKTGPDGVGEHIDLGPNSSFRGEPRRRAQPRWRVFIHPQHPRESRGARRTHRVAPDSAQQTLRLPGPGQHREVAHHHAIKVGSARADRRQRQSSRGFGMSTTPIGWYCDAATSRGGRQVRWQADEPNEAFNAVHMGGPLAEWHPIFGSPAADADAPQGMRTWPRNAARIVRQWEGDAIAGSRPSYYTNGVFALGCAQLAELLDGLAAPADTTDAAYDVIAAGDIEIVETWIAAKARGAAFIPADAHHLANMTLHMIREVRASRSASASAGADVHSSTPGAPA